MIKFNFLLLLAILTCTVFGSKDSERFESHVSNDSGDESEEQVSDQCGSGIEWDNVICHQTSNPTWWQQQRSVVRMTLTKNGKSYVCTAWKVQNAKTSAAPTQRRRWFSNIIRRRRVDRRRRSRRRWTEKGEEMDDEAKDVEARRILQDFADDNPEFDTNEFEDNFEETFEKETGDKKEDGEQAVAWGRRRRRRRAPVKHNDLYLTAQHCQGSSMRIQFDYRTTSCTGSSTTTLSNSCALKASPVASSSSKDWMLIEVANGCTLSTNTPKLKITQDYGKVGDHIYLIGHPGGKPKVISHTEPQNQKCHLTADSGHQLDYHCDSKGGMSGCPVFKRSTGSAIAIHTNGGCSGTRRRRGWSWGTRRRANKGTKLSEIVVSAGHFLTFSPSDEHENQISSQTAGEEEVNAGDEEVIAGEEQVSNEDEEISKIIDLDE